MEDNSCDVMKMDLNNQIYVDMIMYKYSNNIKITHKNISKINMDCDNPKNKRWVEYNIKNIITI